MNAAEAERLAQRIADEVLGMLALGLQGLTVPVPELGETWTISREPAS